MTGRIRCPPPLCDNLAADDLLSRLVKNQRQLALNLKPFVGGFGNTKTKFVNVFAGYVSEICNSISLLISSASTILMPPATTVRRRQTAGSC